MDLNNTDPSTWTDPELEDIVRRAENTNISGSLYQRAKNEMEIRVARRASGVINVGGNIYNNGVIQTSGAATTFQGNTKEKDSWFSIKNPFVDIISGVIIGLIIYALTQQ